ncbi:hypothetical protein Tco_1026471 [Tanacetum coccineum]|uniref:Uncharacterized protein n=1 Tax=Tanacetum coccineum TaxID=301880 RepID=A0ABQ5CEB8_9ASTR
MWNTLKLADYEDVFKFMVDKEEVTFSLNDLRTVLNLPQATANNHAEFVEALELRKGPNAMLNNKDHRNRSTTTSHHANVLLHRQQYACRLCCIDLEMSLLPTHEFHNKNPVLYYPLFTKLIIDHILTTHPDIPNKSNEPHHLVANDDVGQSIFVFRKSKGRGMDNPDWLLTIKIM